MHFARLVKQASVDLVSRPICLFGAYISAMELWVLMHNNAERDLLYKSQYHFFYQVAILAFTIERPPHMYKSLQPSGHVQICLT